MGAISDVILRQSTTMGATDATPNIGAAISAVAITGGSLSEVFFLRAPNAFGGANYIQYESIAWLWNHGSESLNSCVVYLPNALAVVGASGTVTITCADAADYTGTKKARIIGEDAAGNPVVEETTLSAASNAGAQTFSQVYRVEIRLVSGSTLVTAVGAITVTRGSALGEVPAPANGVSWSSATGEHDFGLEPTLGTSTTAATPITAPSSGGAIAFARPRTAATGTQVNSGGGTPGQMTFGTNQQTWVRLTLADGVLSSGDVQHGIALNGNNY